MTSTPHVKAFDLPGWPCPPRVRDIPGVEESWGWIRIVDNERGALVQDELGYLWVDGDSVPQFRLPDDGPSTVNPGGVACWTEQGLGVWVHPRSLRSVGSMSRLEMDGDRWIPVAVALHDLPPYVKGIAGES